MPHDVFISHSSRDQAVADQVCKTLEEHNIRCWISPRDVVPGALYGEALIDAINASRVMVVVLSSHSNQSTQVAREVERAGSKGLIIIPLLLERVTLSKALEFFVSDHHWLEAIDPPLDRHLRRLVQSVSSMLKNPEDISCKTSVAPNKSADDIEITAVETEPTISNAPAISLYICESGDPESTQCLEVTDGRRIVMGRDKSCELVINSKLLSRKHAMIQYEPSSGWTFCDLGSTNGSTLNGARVKGTQPVVLGSRDTISIGTATIQVVIHSGQQSFPNRVLNKLRNSFGLGDEKRP